MINKDNNTLPKEEKKAVYTDYEGNKLTKQIFGIFLLVSGIVVCGFILYAVYALLSGGEYIKLLQTIIPHDLSSSASGEMAGLIKLAEQMFLIIGYIVVLFLLSLAIRIAKLLLQTGAGLLNSDLSTLVARLQKELMKWREEGY